MSFPIPAWLTPVTDFLFTGNEANASVELFLLLFCLLAMLAVRNRSFAGFAQAEALLKRWAGSDRRALLLALAFPLVARVALLWVYPPPQPWVHDEFSYLLIADTLKEGRLTNLPHPLWEHFETIHVFFQPTYSSKYPVGNGLVLALPQLLGLPPYVGIWLSCSLMSAAVYWMLRAWVPAHWALFAALLLLARESVMSSWMHTYWGGAVAATGGALAIGATARLLHIARRRQAWLLGAGIFILAITRPYEGLALTLVLGGALAVWLVRGGVDRGKRLQAIALPLAVCAAITVGFIALHNYAVTGDPTLLPYAHNRALYGTPQSFYWQDPVPPPPGFRHKPLADNYRWQLDVRREVDSVTGWLRSIGWKMKEFWLFFIGPCLSIPLLFLFAGKRPKRLLLALAAVAAVLLAVNCYPFFYYHYFAPITGLILLFQLLGLEALRRWKPPLGLHLARAVAVALVLSYAWQIGLDMIHKTMRQNADRPRMQVERALQNMGGQHVVIVRYAPDHDFHHEIVYNAADIDGSAIVWARDMGPLKNQELETYYRGRKFWSFEPDVKPPRLTPYQGLRF